MKKILLLNCHPDDEVLSFGGLMAKAKRKGYSIKSHTFCVGGLSSNVDSNIRLLELKNVMEYFGIKEYSFDLGKDGALDQVPNSVLVGKIDKMISEFEPDEVYCSPDSEHEDHHVLAKAFMASARLKTGFMPKLFAFGTYQFSDQLYRTLDGGKIFNPLTDEDFKMKCDAFSLHKSQFKPSPNPLGIDGLRIQAEYNGLMCGAKYAELYYQLRYIKEY